MQAEKQQQPWNLYVHARAKAFQFKFKATTILPSTKFFRFSLFLKLWSFLIQVKFEPIKKQSFKSKFLRILNKFQIRRAKNKAIILSKPEISRWFAYEGASVLGGNLGLLFQSICEKDKKGIIVHAAVVFLYFASIFRNYFGRKACTFLVILTVAMVGCSMWRHLKNYLSYGEDCHVSKYVWMA